MPFNIRDVPQAITERRMDTKFSPSKKNLANKSKFTTTHNRQRQQNGREEDKTTKKNASTELMTSFTMTTLLQDSTFISVIHASSDGGVP